MSDGTATLTGGTLSGLQSLPPSVCDGSRLRSTVTDWIDCECRQYLAVWGVHIDIDNSAGVFWIVHMPLATVLLSVGCRVGWSSVVGSSVRLSVVLFTPLLIVRLCT